MFSSGRVPVRAAGVDLGLPTIGTGGYEWNGFYPAAQHPQAVNPSGDRILNWNNKPAAGWTAADDEWAYGSVHRGELLENAVARQDTHSLGSLVAAMNRAATQDLRDAEVLPAIEAVLRPVRRRARASSRCSTCSSSGGRRARAASTATSTGRSTHRARRSWTRVAEDRRRGDEPRAGSAARTLAEPHHPRQQAQQPGLGVRLRLVRLRRQGPAEAARPACRRVVQDAVLRRGRSDRVPGLALAGARGCGRRARRGTGHERSRSVAIGCDSGADRVPAEASRSRCAGPTGRPSSR